MEIAKSFCKKVIPLKGVGLCMFFFALLPTSTVFAENFIDSLIQENASSVEQGKFDIQPSNRGRVASNVPLLRAQTLKYMESNIKKYEAIVAKGGWGYVPQTEQPLHIGVSDPVVRNLRYRLLASGDLIKAAGVPSFFDSYLQAAVKRFQLRHGLPASGIVDKYTYKALNVSAAQRSSDLLIPYFISMDLKNHVSQIMQSNCLITII